MKKIILCVLFVYNWQNLYVCAQGFDFHSTLRKYWKARGRLIGDENNRNIYNGFMVIGGQAGMSIPAEETLLTC